ncbi:MAG: SIS domain-containing protein [Chloroflexota bacterium]|nr:SIS domain-containing protein [Chloroflexota bacterium]
MGLRDEIYEQPAAARRLLQAGRPLSESMASRLHRRRPSSVVVAARGTSDHAALYAQYLFGIRNSLVVALATPSAITLYGARPRFADALVLGISQSGRSPDIVAVLEEARRQGAPTVAITNDASSPLAAAADETIELAAGPELATAATKTYTTELLAVAKLSLALDDGTPAEHRQLQSVAGWMEEALTVEAEAERLAGEEQGLSSCVVLGRGYEYATAREWALKLQELAQLHALAFSAADFEHGPLALAEPGFAVLAVAPSGAALAAQQQLLEDLHRAYGARLITVSDDAAARRIDRGLPLPVGVPEWLGPLVSIIAGQLFALHLTAARGLDPDAPRSLSKVTETL